MKYFFTSFLFLTGILVLAQPNLPDEFHYSTDGKVLYTGGIIPASGLYDKSTIKNVYLNFSQVDYWTQLTNNYVSETNIPATMIYDDVIYPNVGIRFRGNTSYTTTGNSQKKSFSVETDFVDINQELLGYNDLKFNNAHQDPTFMREVLFCRMAARHTPIAKANYIHLYINNQDWGLYPNVQAVDKQFLSEWFLSNDGARFRATTGANGNGGGSPSWGDGTAAMNFLGTAETSYQQYYTLSSNDVVVDPWQKLIDACFSLSTITASNIETVKTKIDIDKVLWHMACENIFTDSDSYIAKGKMDYMVYYEPETGRTTSLEYDGNSSFQLNAATSANWSPFKNVNVANYPLLNKLILIPELRQRYLAHYRAILNETFTTSNSTAIIDELNNQIGALVSTDPKKLYTTAEYISGIPALKSFVTNRRNYLVSNIEVAQIAPTIASAKYYNSADEEYVAPIANEMSNIKAVVTSSSGINKVLLYYATGLVGNFTKIQMYDDGQHNDGGAGDGTYGAQIPGYLANTLVRYYIEAIANNASLSASYLPTGAEHDVFVYVVNQINVANGVVINEVMAQNTSGNTDEVGEVEDWIELYNNNNYSVNLSGFNLSDDSTSLNKWQFSEGTIIPANGYLIVWCDDESSDGILHASWKIAASGETISLTDSFQNLVDQVAFDAQTADMALARVPNGVGNFQIQNPTYNLNNDSDLGINQPGSNLNTMLVYPNPTSENINIVLSQLLGNQKIKIFNQLGQLLLESEANYQTTLNVASLENGTYFIKYGTVLKKLAVFK